MSDALPTSLRPAPRRLTGLRCLRWIGSALLLGGAFILGWDIFAGFTRGTRWHLALTCLADVLPSLSRYSVAPPWAQLIEGGLEFAAVTPLALVLCGLGWCARILSPGESGADPAAGRASREAGGIDGRREGAERSLLQGESDRNLLPRARRRG